MINQGKRILNQWNYAFKLKANPVNDKQMEDPKQEKHEFNKCIKTNH